MEYSLCITLDEDASAQDVIDAIDEAAKSALVALRGTYRLFDVDESVTLATAGRALQDATLQRLA